MKKILHIGGIILFCSMSWKNYAQWSCGDMFLISKDSIDFETYSSYLWLDTSSGNIWQIGKPNKIFFDSAYSPDRAIVTDTINYYPPENSSSFTILFPSYLTEWPDRTSLQFWHKYDMDTLMDKGIIEVSYDNGNSWLLVSDTGGCYGWGFYWCDDYHVSTGIYSAHPVITTGKSDGWILSDFEWSWFILVKSSDTIICNPDSMMVRFTFTSDSVDNSREGWIIDGIMLGSYMGPGGTDEMLLENQVAIFPDPSNGTMQMNYSLKASSYGQLTIFDITGKEMVKYKLAEKQNMLLINEGTLKNGIYFYEIKIDNSKVIRDKLVIIK